MTASPKTPAPLPSPYLAVGLGPDLAHEEAVVRVQVRVGADRFQQPRERLRGKRFEVVREG